MKNVKKLLPLPLYILVGLDGSFGALILSVAVLHYATFIADFIDTNFNFYLNVISLSILYFVGSYTAMSLLSMNGVSKIFTPYSKKTALILSALGTVAFLGLWYLGTVAIHNTKSNIIYGL